MAQKVLATVAGLLVVPIAVNIGTGGTPPSWLAPFAGWVWPVAGVCVVVIVVLELVEQRNSIGEAISALRRHDVRNIDRALDQIARYVDARQHGALAERVRIALSLDERPDAVRQPVHLVRRIGAGEHRAEAAGDIAALFSELSDSMLILGAPGAGKTTQLLDLAERLVRDGRAERRRSSDAEPPLPVVVDLAEWSQSGLRRRWVRWLRRTSSPLSMSSWLAITLRERYGIPLLVSGHWLAEDKLVLLLDGLDEVSESDRERCVQEIDELQHTVTRLAVCCRTADYASLRGRLRLQGAVEIRPFRPDQVVSFLSTVSPQLRGVAEALSADNELRELLTTPLMLNVMALAYGDESPRPISADGAPDIRRRLLFDAYVVEVLARYRARIWNVDIKKALLVLRVLARFSKALGSDANVRQLRADTSERGLDAIQKQIKVGWLLVGPGFLGAIALAAVVAGEAGVEAGLLAGEVAWLSAFLFRTNARLTSSNSGHISMVRYLLFFLWSALVAGFVYLTASTLLVLTRYFMPAAVDGSNPLMAGIAGFITAGSFALLVGGPFASAIDDSVPDSSIQRVFVVQTWLAALGIVIASVFFKPSESYGLWSMLTASIGAVVGYFACSIFSENRIVPSFSRFAFVMAGEPDPWRRSFLRFAADRSLLMAIDSEYRFAHLLIRDYLADCDPAVLTNAVTTRRDQLSQGV